jgi:hypothetical protein
LPTTPFVRAVHGRAGEARGDAGPCNRRPGHAHEDPRAGAELVGYDVEHVDVELADRRALHDRAGRAVHAAVNVLQRRDRIACPRRRRGQQQQEDRTGEKAPHARHHIRTGPGMRRID